jgi:hypothetical protein
VAALARGEAERILQSLTLENIVTESSTILLSEIDSGQMESLLGLRWFDNYDVSRWAGRAELSN